MNKVLIIIAREFLSRVRQKMFLITTILAPILLVAFYALLAFIMLKKDDTQRTIAVVNRTELVNPLQNNANTTYKYLKGIDNCKELVENDQYYAVLELPSDMEQKNQGVLYSRKQIPAEVSGTISKELEQLLEERKLKKLTQELNVPELEKRIAATKTNIRLTNIKLEEDGKEVKTSSTAAQILSFVAMGVGFVIFFLVITYGSIVMRGVVEEKSNRVVEVIISSVKPFQLMMGKIIGIALVGLTQIVVWVIIVGALYFIAMPIVMSYMDMGQVQEMAKGGQQMAQMGGMDFLKDSFDGFDLGQLIQLLIVSFIYMILGYILYASFFAAAGSAADNESDSQQLTMPITLPLIAAFYIGFNVARNPETPLAFWSSIIPFTSPIVMPVRIPFGVPWWELALSLVLLLVTILGCVLLAAKIYRTGILMYGKKVSFKEIYKWLRYRN